tara:strand:+ start:277 stop:426 length:150 start_codon:yes stop_codon:yes gene_type:complete
MELETKKENLKAQLKQAEAYYLKLQGALELVETMIEEQKGDKKEKKEKK